MTLQEMRDSLRLHLGVDDVDLDDPASDSLLNASLSEIDNKFPFKEKERRLDFTTTIGEYKYQLPTIMDAIRVVSITDPISEDKSVLERMTPYAYEDNTTLDTDLRGEPCGYMREQDCIILHPTPDDEYAITIRYLRTLAELLAADDEPALPANWHEILLYGAVWRGFILLGDFNRANQVKAHQVALITSTVPNESKEEFDTHTGGVQVLGRSYSRR